MSLIEVADLKKYFPVQRTLLEKLLTRRREFVRAVDGVSFAIGKGEVLGLAGESGSGKTTIGRIMVRLEEPTSGKIVYDGVNLFSVQGEALRRFRRRIQMIFQDPYASLNPRMKVGDLIGHPLAIHGMASGNEKRRQVYEMMEKVGLAPASLLYDKYPHQLSGGQRQRVAIARALILRPELVVADEPVAMVDVSVRALILDLMMRLKEEYDLTYLFITHDLATAKYICDRIAVMYLGKIVEVGPADELFRYPLHPYTMALLSAVPIPSLRAKRDRMIPKGEIPNAINPPKGCRFHPRCPFAMDVCRLREPSLVEVKPGHLAACHLAS